MSGAERYIERYRAQGGIQVVAPPDRRRMLALTAAFTPMVAVAAFPVAAAVAVVASIVANLTARWVGVVMLVVAAVALGYGTARWAANYDEAPASSGLRRWLPLAATVIVVGCCVTEIGSGSRAPDPVIPLWLGSAVWVYAFLPMAVGAWGPSRRTMWAVGPLVTFIAILFVWTQGFFSLRFDRALSDLDTIAQQVADGDRVPANTHAGGFIVHHVDSGQIARSKECDVGFWITGWHQEDTRYIAHCIGRPTSRDVMHLAGSWWQVTDKQAPSNL